MSFILDALRKSETERQRQTGPGLVDAGYRPPASRTGIWLPLLVVVLVINAVVIGLFWQRSSTPDSAPTPASAPAPAETAAVPVEPPPPPVGRSAAAPADSGALADAEFAATADLPALEPEAFTEVLVPPAEPPQDGAGKTQIVTESLPSADQLIATGALPGKMMHLDIHVYSDNPKERFVFINMSKYTEGMKLPDGPLLEEITPDGAVFTYNGQQFLLARD